MPQVNHCNQSFRTKQQNLCYPPLEVHREKVFVVVKTAPRPSKSFREIVCTAGITETGKWIRLYPIPYRYMDDFLKYSKYQWISVEIEKSQNDPRVDSYKPKLKTLKLIGKKYPTDNKWEKRKQIVFPTLKRSLEEIKTDYNKNKVSLGIFKPKRVYDFKIEADNRDWSDAHKKVLFQQRLFEQQPKYLERVPYKFSYKFECNDSWCRGNHQLQIIDWEIYELYRRIKENYKKPINEVLKDITKKWFEEMWGVAKDSYLIVGSVHKFPSFVVLGVFWPSK